MTKKRTTITISPGVYEHAQKLMALLHHDDFSGFLEQLIRDEWEHRNGPVSMRDANSASTPERKADAVTDEAASEANAPGAQGDGQPATEFRYPKPKRSSRKRGDS